MDQAIFKKVYVDDGVGVTSEFSEPFELLLSSEVIEAARNHAQVLDTDPDFIERELEALYREWSEDRGLVGAAVGNEQTPTLPRRVLNYDSLVDLKGRLQNPPQLRLSPTDIDDHVEAYQAGATICQLAANHGTPWRSRSPPQRADRIG